MNPQSPVRSEPEHPVRFTLPSGSHRKIAIAVDLSDESAYAVRWAVQNYLRPGDTVILLHVRPTSVLYGADWGSVDLTITNDGDDGAAASEEESRRKLEDDFDNFTATKASDMAGPDAQVVMTSAESSAAAWNRLNKQYANRSRTRVMSLKERLATITKGTSSVSDYLRSIRVIADELALIGHPIDDLDLVIAALNGLGPSFREFTASIRTRDSPLLFDELFDKLVDFEIFMQREERQHQSFPATANYTTRSHGSNRGKRPSSGTTSPPKHNASNSGNSNSGSKRSVPVVCQYCDRRGHTAKTCYRLIGYPPDHPRHQANLAHHEEPSDPSWLLDSGASHHVTHDLNRLSISNEYNGSDQLHVANGKEPENGSGSSARKN